MSLLKSHAWYIARRTTWTYCCCTRFTAGSILYCNPIQTVCCYFQLRFAPRFFGGGDQAYVTKKIGGIMLVYLTCGRAKR